MFEPSMALTGSYINLHTHHASPGHGVFVFNNRFAHDPLYYTGSLFSIGVHPWDAALPGALQQDELEKLLQHPNCFALGECGLDKLHGPDLSIQKDVFGMQLELALHHSMPVIIHCVKAFDELMEMAKPYAERVPLVIHGFHKSAQMAAQLIDKGFYLSLNPALIGRKDFDSSVIPLERLFLETDMREDLSILEVYQAAAAWFNVGEDELKERINGNFETLKQK
jgi:TatD DNase family protein